MICGGPVVTLPVIGGGRSLVAPTASGQAVQVGKRLLRFRARERVASGLTRTGLSGEGEAQVTRGNGICAQVDMSLGKSFDCRVWARSV